MADAPDNSDDHPVRYVITNMAHPEGSLAGLRVLTFPAWGSRYTYATREEAEEQMKLMWPDWRGASADVPIEHNREEGGR